ncbi:diacylglycerol kinase [Halobacillus litoralis]|uniref:diacylglycerol kinase n=1 Tax=Halobacillus litoralis TaxID=45668 RepID=UPI001CD6C159|nr:diacylglycerol kinase [Halobacillus litoralis]MCA1021421.1 diacylglycerol kinase [Halobacillus litoralis]
MNSGSSDPKKKGIGFACAWKGIRLVWSSERNFRIHTAAAVLALTAGGILGLSTVEWAVLIVTIALVLTLEMVNSAVEKLLDHLHPSHHQAVGAVKDVSAGAVLTAAGGSVVVGIFLFGPKLAAVLM